MSKFLSIPIACAIFVASFGYFVYVLNSEALRVMIDISHQFALFVATFPPLVGFWVAGAIVSKKIRRNNTFDDYVVVTNDNIECVAPSANFIANSEEDEKHTNKSSEAESEIKQDNN